MAHILLEKPSNEEGIKSALGRLLEYFNGNRAYIFELNHEEGTFTNTYEICAQGVTSEIEHLQNIPLDVVSFWLDAFNRETHISIDSVDLIDESRSDEKQVLAAQGIESLIAVPIKRDGKMMGFMGIDDPKQAKTRVDRLVALGDYMAVMLTRRDLDDQIANDNAKLQNLVCELEQAEEHRNRLLDNIPTGAALYEFDGQNITAKHLNRSYKELVGREPTDLMRADVLASTHPDDRALIKGEIAAAIRQKRDAVCDIRLRYGSGEDDYRYFHAAGRIIPHANSTYSIYAAFTPIEDEKVSIQQMLPKALEAMMSSSADYSFVKDKDLHYICCSRTMANMLGLKSERDIIGKTDNDIFSEPFAQSFIATDRQLIKTGESLINHTEELPSNDGKIHYAVTSKYLLHDTKGNIIGIYGSSRDVTAIREASSQLKLLTDSIPGGIATYTYSPTELTVAYFNDGFCRLFGSTREEYEKRGTVDQLSWIYKEDHAKLKAQLDSLVKNNTPIDCVLRAHTKQGGYKWINLKALAAERYGEKVTINSVLFDVTEQQEAAERLSMSEKQFRVAVALSERIVARYDIKTRTYYNDNELLFAQGFGREIQNAPEVFIEADLVAQESISDFRVFYQSVCNGAKSASATVSLRTPDGSFRWFRLDMIGFFDADSRPSEAIIVFFDITDQLKKEAVYKKWQQSLEDKDPESYTLFRCNISKNASFDSMEGKLLKINFKEGHWGFSERTKEYVEQYVSDEDKEHYLAFVNSDTMLASYYRGKRSDAIEYREKLPHGGVRWLKLSIDLVEYSNSKDIEAYMMFEDINNTKRAELLTVERAETDPLTGLLNRAAFISKVNKLIDTSKSDTRFALLMMDVDGFKLVNDAFGHGAGDQALIDIANALRTALRRDDLISRLGGDEFVVFLDNIPDRSIAAKKAKQIGDLVRKSFSMEVSISASIGIAYCPDDGNSFESLYEKADSALYYVKGTGKDDFAFYRENMDEEELERPVLSGGSKPVSKRRMLIVDDSKVDNEMLTKLFSDEFIIDRANDGSSALMRLRHFGTAISVVLLDIMMPGLDGYGVLEKMRANPQMQAIPVIVVSGDDNRESSLRAIRAGASDFVTKPVDPDLLRLRVQSAISKAENERLRAQNSYLALKHDEAVRYKALLERLSASVITVDWGLGKFTYDESVSSLIAGTYDDRPFWRILLSDMVADTVTVQKMQELAYNVARDRDMHEGSMWAQLKTPDSKLHWFKMNVYKQVLESQLTDKLIIMLSDIGEKLPKE